MHILHTSSLRQSGKESACPKIMRVADLVDDQTVVKKALEMSEHTLSPCENSFVEEGGLCQLNLPCV